MNILRKISPLLIILAGVICYAGSFSGVFVFDDYVWIVNNNDIKTFWTSILGSSRPLIGFTFYLNYLIGGLKVADYHAVNLLIHLSAGLLLFGILGNTLRLPKLVDRYGGNSWLIALIITLIWVVHPLNTESVTYIVQRSESMMGMLYLLTLYCFSRGVNAHIHSDRWYTGGIIACALGMACKPVMVTAPLVVLLYDRAFVSSSFTEALKRRRFVYAGLAATWIVLVALVSVPNESSSSAGFGALTISPASYCMTQAGVVLHYIKLVFCPVNLCLDYDWPAAGLSAMTFFQMSLLTLFAFLFLRLFIQQRIAGFAGITFIILLLPSSSFVPLSDCAAEHRMYLPLIPVVILICIAVAEIIRMFSWGAASRGWVRMFPLFLALIIVAGLSELTILRNRIYQSEELIWRDVISLRPGNLRAHLGLGNVCLRTGRNKQAEVNFLRILGDSRLADRDARLKYATELAMAYNNIGVIRFQAGMYRDAADCFSKALATGFSLDAQRNLGLAQSKLKELESIQ